MTVHVRHATLRDVSYAASLPNASLSSAVDQVVGEVIDSGGLCLLAEIDDRLVGVAMAQITDNPKALLPRGQEYLVDRLAVCEPVGYMRTSTVAQTHRKQGIGTLLTQHRLRWMISRDVLSAFCTVWVHRDGSAPSRSQLVRSGFRSVGLTSNFWQRQLLEDAERCSECGTLCRCSADLFVWSA